MNIIIVDDEHLALKSTERAIRAALPDSTPFCFNIPSKALLHAQENQVDVAFLDVEMGGMSGLELAKQLKDIYGKTNIVFVTGYSQYAVDSYSLPASGYIMKPASEQEILHVVNHLRNPVPKMDHRLRVQCFGNFDVFVDGARLHFCRSKAKELFAFLIHKKGTSCTTRELIAVLFEDKQDDTSLQKQIQTNISAMMRTLENAGVKDVIIKSFNSLSVDTNKVDCDYYHFLWRDTDAVNEYTGEYMSSYSWAEFTVGYLDSRRR